MRTWDDINNCLSYKFTFEPNELYDDIADYCYNDEDFVLITTKK